MPVLLYLPICPTLLGNELLLFRLLLHVSFWQRRSMLHMGTRLDFIFWISTTILVGVATMVALQCRCYSARRCELFLVNLEWQYQKRNKVENSFGSEKEMTPLPASSYSWGYYLYNKEDKRVYEAL